MMDTYVCEERWRRRREMESGVMCVVRVCVRAMVVERWKMAAPRVA